LGRTERGDNLSLRPCAKCDVFIASSLLHTEFAGRLRKDGMSNVSQMIRRPDICGWYCFLLISEISFSYESGLETFWSLSWGQTGLWAVRTWVIAIAFPIDAFNLFSSLSLPSRWSRC
jgi:hypothetical protein